MTASFDFFLPGSRKVLGDTLTPSLFDDLGCIKRMSSLRGAHHVGDYDLLIFLVCKSKQNYLAVRLECPVQVIMSIRERTKLAQARSGSTNSTRQRTSLQPSGLWKLSLRDDTPT